MGEVRGGAGRGLRSSRVVSVTGGLGRDTYDCFYFVWKSLLALKLTSAGWPESLSGIKLKEERC